MNQLKYKSTIMSRDIKPANFVSPRGKPPVTNKAKLALNKNLFSVLDVVIVIAAILAIKFVLHHVSVNFH